MIFLKTKFAVFIYHKFKETFDTQYLSKKKKKENKKKQQQVLNLLHCMCTISYKKKEKKSMRKGCMTKSC